MMALFSKECGVMAFAVNAGYVFYHVVDRIDLKKKDDIKIVKYKAVIGSNLLMVTVLLTKILILINQHTNPHT